MANATAIFNEGHISVDFTATISPDWDGSGRPLVDVSDVEIVALSILSVEITEEQFDLFPEALQTAIFELSDGLEFEGELEDDSDYAYEQSSDE